MTWLLVCEVIPGIIRVLDNVPLEEAEEVAREMAEGFYLLYGSSQYIVVKDTQYDGYYCVRYSPENGGTYYIPEEMHH